MARWVYPKGASKGIPAEEYYATKADPAFTFMPDIPEFQSPIDYSFISSRSQLREHERRHGVRQCGELKTPADFDWRKHKTYRSVIDD